MTYEIRAALEDDVESLNVIYNHYVANSHVTFDVEPMSPQLRRVWLAEHRGGPYRVLLAVRDSKVAGYASSGRHRARAAYDTTVETSVYVAPDQLGQGIGGRLYSALFKLIDRQNVHRAVAGIAQPNDASVALHVRLGFRFVGRFTEQGKKFGRYWDVDWYERGIASGGS